MKRVFLVMVAVIAMVCSCQKERTNNETNENANANDEIILQQENITLQQEDTYGIKMKKGHTCKSENNFVAIVSADGKVTARHVGSTDIVVSNGKEIKKMRVNVTSKINLFPMPILDFGINVEEVKKRQNGKEICDYTDDGNLLLRYSYYTNEISYCTYAFDENDKLEATMLVFKSLSYQQKVKSYLEEHFNFVGRSQGRLLFVNADPEDIKAKKKGIILAIVGVEYLRKESDLKLYVFFNLWE